MGLVCKETAEEYELVIPHAIIDDVVQNQRICAKFYPNQYGVTGFYSAVDDKDVVGERVRVEEHHAEKVFGPNRPPEWLVSILPQSKT